MLGGYVHPHADLHSEVHQAIATAWEAFHSQSALASTKELSVEDKNPLSQRFPCHGVGKWEKIADRHRAAPEWSHAETGDEQDRTMVANRHGRLASILRKNMMLGFVTEAMDPGRDPTVGFGHCSLVVAIGRGCGDNGSSRAREMGVPGSTVDRRAVAAHHSLFERGQRRAVGESEPQAATSREAKVGRPIAGHCQHVQGRKQGRSMHTS